MSAATKHEWHESKPMPRRVAQAAVLCALSEGQALYIPALWSHAVASEAAGGLNAALNLWFTRGTASFDAAVHDAPTFGPALVCRAEALKMLDRRAEAAADLVAALALPSASLPASLRASTEAELQAARTIEFRRQLRREIVSSGGWSRGVEQRVRDRVSVWPQQRTQQAHGVFGDFREPQPQPASRPSSLAARVAHGSSSDAKAEL